MIGYFPDIKEVFVEKLKKRFDRYLSPPFLGNDFDEIEIFYSEEARHLARFCDNEVIQNIGQRRHMVRFKLIKDQKIGIASTNNLDGASLSKTYKRALEALMYSPKNENLLPLYTDEMIDYPQFDEGDMTPLTQAQEIQKAFEYLDQEGFKGTGIHTYGFERRVLMNSRGLYRDFRLPTGIFSLSILSPTKSWAEQVVQDLHDLDTLAVAKRAVTIARLNHDAKSIKAGKYTVILSPEAIADLVTYLGWVAFNGLHLVEKTGPFTELGGQVIDPRLTIVDDPHNPQKQGFPFDFEGINKTKLPLIKNGILENVTHDRYTAKEAGVESTGHSYIQPNPHGASPSNIVFSGGDKTLDQLIESTENGLYINRFHYLSIINPKDMTVTGMTRDGVFEIKDGKIGDAVKNMRFTESILDVLNRVDAFTQETRVAGEFFDPSSSVITPFMKITDFNFTSTTDF